MATLNHYKKLDTIYQILRRKDYSQNATLKFIAGCKVLSKNKEQLNPKLTDKNLDKMLNVCRREAEKEVKIY